MLFDNSIDEKNIHLLRLFEDAGVDIVYEIRPEFKTWAMQPRNKYVVVAPDMNPNPEMLTHELLHVKIEILGYLSTWVLMDIFQPHNCHFNTHEIGLMHNQLAHIKMFPLFVAMGYDYSKFVANNRKEFMYKEFLPAAISTTAMWELNKSIKVKPEIILVTNFLTKVIGVVNMEMEMKFTKQSSEEVNAIIDLLLKAYEKLFNALHQEITSWANENTYRNYDLHISLNKILADFGYPTQNNWEAWKYS